MAECPDFQSGESGIVTHRLYQVLSLPASFTGLGQNATNVQKEVRFLSRVPRIGGRQARHSAVYGDYAGSLPVRSANFVLVVQGQASLILNQQTGVQLSARTPSSGPSKLDTAVQPTLNVRRRS